MSVADSDNFDIAVVGRIVGTMAADMIVVDLQAVAPATALGILDYMLEMMLGVTPMHGAGDQRNGSADEYAARSH